MLLLLLAGAPPYSKAFLGRICIVLSLVMLRAVGFWLLHDRY